MPSSEFLGLRVTIEGIEVPVVNITANVSVMGHARAQITVPATDAIHKLLPKSLIHAYYFDGSARVDGGRYATTGTESLALINDADITNPHRWKLLFVGEFHSLQYMKTLGNRTVTLGCYGFTSYWDQAKIYWGSGGIHNKFMRTAVNMGASRVDSGKSKVDTTGELLSLLQAKPSTHPTLQGLLGGLVHLLESITGVYDRNVKNRFRGVSDFMSQAEMRLHLTKMLGAAADDTSSKSFLNSVEFRKYLNQVSSSLSHTASYGQLVRVLLDRTFHIYSPQLCPAYIPAGDKARYLKLVPSGNAKMSKEAEALKAELLKNVSALNSAADARRGETANRQEKDGYQYTTTKFVNGLIDNAGQASWKGKWVGKVPLPTTVADTRAKVAALTPDQISKSARRHLFDLARHTDSAASVMSSKLMFTPKNVATVPDFPEHKTANFERIFDDIAKAFIAGRATDKQKYKTVESEVTLSDRLIATTFNPQIWMCPPPKCNVVFPNRYLSIAFSRDHMAEVTRMWLHGQSSTGTAIYGQSYFSPNLDIVMAGMATTDVAKAAMESQSFLLPHEKFTGIIASIQGLGYAEPLRKLNKEVEKAAGETMPISSHNSKNPAMARAANSKFLQERFKPRQASVQGAFNPNLVCGLPALVLDPTIVSGLSSSELRGTHYLGQISSITHSIGQSGASTSFTMDYCRAHNEGLELFGDKSGAEVTLQKKVVIGPGKKVRTATGEELVAEVYSWKFANRRIKKDGKYVTIVDVVPVLGMLGVRGAVGKHITAGLAQQGIGSSDKTLVTGGKVIGQAAAGASTDDKKDFANNFTDGKAFKYEHRIVPKKYEQNDVTHLAHNMGIPVGSIPLRILRDETYISGRKYYRAKPWMSPKAVGAVVVNAFQGRRATSSSKKVDFTFTFEQIARPPWLAPIYLNPEIGPKVYQSLYRCGSLVDPILIGIADKAYTAAYATGVDDYGSGNRKLTFAESELLKKASANKAEVKNRNETMKIISDLMGQKDIEPLQKVIVRADNGEEYIVPAKALGGKPIEAAAEDLAAAYIGLEAAGADMNVFTDTFTSRAHASMVDMFGLGFRPGAVDSKGKRSGVIGAFSFRPQSRYDPDGTMTVADEYAKDGFHSRAFGPFENLDMLDNEPLLDVKGRNQRSVSPSVDPRAERYQRVTDYIESLGGGGSRI